VLAVVDTGPLYAAADEGDADHGRCLEVLERADLQLVIPTLVVAEATYLIGTRLGARAEATFLASLEKLDVQAPEPEDWSRIGALVKRYSSLDLGGIDASVIVLAERRGTDLVVTLDRRHFEIVRTRQRRALKLLPELE
jgi:hypothetical protein